MNSLTRIAALSIVVLCIASSALAEPASPPAEPDQVPEAEDAQEADKVVDSGHQFISLGRSIAIAVVVIGAAYAISKIGSAAVDSMARQPEVAGNIQLAMIVAGALVEGITFFALIVYLAELFVE